MLRTLLWDFVVVARNPSSKSPKKHPYLPLATIVALYNSITRMELIKLSIFFQLTGSNVCTVHQYKDGIRNLFYRSGTRCLCQGNTYLHFHTNIFLNPTLQIRFTRSILIIIISVFTILFKSITIIKNINLLKHLSNCEAPKMQIKQK